MTKVHATTGSRDKVGVGSLTRETLAEIATRAAGCLAEGQYEGNLTEQRHLDPCFRRVASSVLGASPTVTAVRGQLPARLDAWPRLGKFDLAAEWFDSGWSAFELKCGVGRDALGPCVWDAAKCALALAEDPLISEAFLVAAAPRASWSAPIRGVEFFAHSTHKMMELRERYLDWWRHWEKRGDPIPVRLPTGFSTRPVASAAFARSEQEWDLRFSRIELVSEDLVAWRSTLLPADANHT